MERAKSKIAEASFELKYGSGKNVKVKFKSLEIVFGVSLLVEHVQIGGMLELDRQDSVVACSLERWYGIRL